MQSHRGELVFLPAVPEEWSNGSVQGLRSRGGFEIDLKWSDGKPESAVIQSDLGNRLIIRSDNRLRVTSSGRKVKVDFADGRSSFETREGATYQVEFGN